MASALAHLHARSIIHDDIKPENIMWSAEHKRGVLIDFGAALNQNVLSNGYFNPSGTPSYAGPDFLNKIKGPKGDIWSLGITILFSLQYICLPDGEWLLPAVWETGPDRVQMLTWLEEIEQIRNGLAEAMPLISRMLQADSNLRIGSIELLQQLEVTEAD